jgi:hypothetical protein
MLHHQTPTRPELARLAGSPAVAAAGPAARRWLLGLLALGERYEAPSNASDGPRKPPRPSERRPLISRLRQPGR